MLRVDDRGVGGSTGSVSKSTSDDFAGDVLAGVAFLKSRGEIDPDRIGLIGHSEGGIIAPIVATRDPGIAFIVLMAGTGLPGEEILYLQGQLILKASGADEKTLKRQLDLQKSLFAILKTEPDEKSMQRKMQRVGQGDGRRAPRGRAQGARGLGGGDRVPVEDGPIALVPLLPRLRPAPDPGKVRCPVLALIGEKDLQVPPRENLSQIESTLKAGGNKRVTVKELPGLNHLFQTCKTGAPAEYAQIEETLAASALGAIAEWVGEQVKGR